MASRAASISGAKPKRAKPLVELEASGAWLALSSAGMARSLLSSASVSSSLFRLVRLVKEV